MGFGPSNAGGPTIQPKRWPIGMFDVGIWPLSLTFSVRENIMRAYPTSINNVGIPQT
jgi:hypothetical protein